MKVAVLTANLGNFDTLISSVSQLRSDVKFVSFTDQNFPPIEGLTPRLQYRIPKLFGWEMVPGYDAYIWLDGSMRLSDPNAVTWFLQQLGNAEAAFFKHPQRQTVGQEVVHIEEKLQQGNSYITKRYKNGLHSEALQHFNKNERFHDVNLHTSTAFIYRPTPRIRHMMQLWWFYQSRYYTCDQVHLPYAIFESGAIVNQINENQYRVPYIQLVSPHK